MERSCPMIVMQSGCGMPVEFGVVCIGAGVAIGISLGVAVWFERWKAKQPDPEGE